MTRLLSLLVMYAFVLTNAASVAAAVCQHADTRAHAFALHSPDREVAARARGEEAARKNVEQRGALADAAAVQLAGFILPSEPIALAPKSPERMRDRPHDESALTGRSISPLLEPPLA